MGRKINAGKKAEADERLLWQLGFVKVDGELTETWYFGLSPAGDIGVAVQRAEIGGFDVCWHLTDDGGARHYSLQEHVDTVEDAVSSALQQMSSLGVNCAESVNDLLGWNDVGAIRKELGNGRKG